MGTSNSARIDSRGGRLFGLAAALVVGAVAMFLPSPSVAATGDLTQKFGVAGCIAEGGAFGCTNGKGLDGAWSVTVSPDERSVYAASNGDSTSLGALAVFDRTSDGQLTQKAGTAGCISDTGGNCADAVALQRPQDVAVSPDGRSVYAVSNQSDAVAVFDRSITTGALSQKPGAAGCISDDGNPSGQCTDGTALQQPTSVDVSPDGESVYVTSDRDNAVAIFDRNTASGVLTQKPGTSGCIGLRGSFGNCAEGRALGSPREVTVSADGRSTYVASAGSDAVAIFDRSTTTGALTQKPGTAGCISEDGYLGQCADGVALEGVLSIATSSDNSHAYAASALSNAVAVFNRDPASGALVQKPGTAGCISEDGTSGQPSFTPGACVDGKGLVFAAGVEVSPDRRSVYVASGLSDGVAIFDRSPGSGLIAQKQGAEGCISEDSAADCRDGFALDGARSIVVSAGGANAYVASPSSDAVSIFDRELAPAPPQPPGQPGPSDTTPPTLALSGKSKQSNRKRVLVKASCDEACTATVKRKGKATVKRKGNKKRKKNLKLKVVRKQIPAGGTKRFKLRFKGKKTKKLVRRSLRRKGGRINLKLQGTATDAAGNKGKDRFKVRMRK